MKTYKPSEFIIKITEECTKCRICAKECSFGALEIDKKNKSIIKNNSNCVACNRCIAYCPNGSIEITERPFKYKKNYQWSHNYINNIRRQSDQGGMLLAGMGNSREFPIYWDNILIDACQVTNPSIDPLREPMELKTFLGKKPDKLDFWTDKDDYKLTTILEPQLEIETPITFAGMSYGAVSLTVHEALMRAAMQHGTFMNTGEGGLHKSHKKYKDNIVVQCASGRFGIDLDYLNNGVAVEIKIGQGGKPGIGGHLPGEKVTVEISNTRMIPEGSDAISPAPHHDIYSIEDLKQLILALKEATNYEKPIMVKIAAVNNVSAIASGIVRAGASIIVIDGVRGGTGAAPEIIRDHVGIPIELALASVDERLRQEGIRNQASIIASGSIRSSADVVKAIALGADAVAIGTAALVALGCTVCQMCFTGKCAWGLTTQNPDLVNRLDVDDATEKLVNLLNGWNFEIKEMLGAMGVNAIESIRGSRERLRGVGLDKTYLDILGIKPAGI